MEKFLNSITEKAYAKINLKLHILGKRPDGFHQVDMIMQTLNWHDDVTITTTKKMGITVHTAIPGLNNKNNLACRAAQLLAQEFGITPCLDIEIKKRIFVAAGLGGGSSDAAAVLRGCNKLWHLACSDNDLEKLGSRIGSDIPFLVRGGRCRATGRGEILQPCSAKETPYVVLIKPCNIEISTPWAYEAFDQSVQTDTNLKPEPKLMTRSKTDNDLEIPVMNRYPILNEIKEAALSAGAYIAMMSGSGPTIFALTTEKKYQKQIIQKMEQFDCDTVATNFQERL